jgi:hypothetical protein
MWCPGKEGGESSCFSIAAPILKMEGGMKDCKHEKLRIAKEAIDGAKDIDAVVVRCKECGVAISVINNDVMAALNAILQKIRQDNL